jgi:hypothetical protein
MAHKSNDPLAAWLLQLLLQLLLQALPSAASGCQAPKAAIIKHAQAAARVPCAHLFCVEELEHCIRWVCTITTCSNINKH